MKKLLIILTIIALCFTSYIIGYNTATTTDNLELIMPSAEDEDYDWFDTMNDNMDLIDEAFDDVLEFDTSPVLRGNLDVATFNIEGVDATEFGYVDGVTSDIQTQLDASGGHTEEEIEDIVGGMLGGTETNISVTYNDGDNDIDFVVPTADTDTTGVVTDTDWDTFNNKQPSDTALTNISALTYVSPSFIKLTANDTYAVRTLAEVKTDLAYQLSDMSDVGGTTPTDKYVLVADGDSWESRALVEADISDLGTAAALVADKLSVFAATTSAEFAGVISDETGTLKLVYSDSPVFTTQITTPKIVTASNADIIIQPNGTGDTIIYAPADVVTIKTAVATLTIAEAGTVLCSAAGAAYTITLPTAVGHSGLRYHFIKTDANYTLITLDGNGAQTFNYENTTSAPVQTYSRLNTLCAEVTIVSDNANWQVVNEAMGQVPECWTYLSATQLDFTNTTFLRVELNAEEYDIGSNFNIATWVSGNATSTSAGHLVDSGGAFTAVMVGKRVKNTTDTTYTYVTAYTSATDITVRDDIFVDTEGYEIKHAKFVAPVSGTYLINTAILLDAGSVVIDVRYLVAVYNNNSSITQINVYPHTAGYIGIARSIMAPLTKDDYIELFFYNESGGNTVDIYGADKAGTSLQIKLLSKS